MQIVGVSFDEPEANAAWREKKSFAFELWTDRGRELAQLCGAAASVEAKHARRVTCVLDAQARTVLRFDVGLQIGVHPQAVLDAIGTLQAAP